MPAKKVLQGIGQRLEDERWTVSIFEPQAGPEYVVRIQGPGCNWEYTFFGHEQSPELIRDKVRDATQPRQAHSTAGIYDR
jgi:hypothetical protein